MNSKSLKLAGVVLIGVVVLNLILFSFTIIDWKVFLVILAVIALVAYKVVPKMGK
ncbi:MAG: hypothetical protein AABX37_05590 [Nanoarchaeota archaeon]